MKTPEISIILPVYNAEKTLSRCLDSVLCQTFDNWELLLIDDGSADASPDIGMSYASKDERIRMVCQVNAGASAARNKGLDLAQGQWITFIDSDDWIAPDYLAQMWQTALSQQTDVVCCNCFIVRDDQITPLYVYTENQLLTREEMLKRLLTISKVRSELWGKIFKKELLASLRLNIPIRIGEDMLYLIAIYCVHPLKTYILKEPLYYYCQSDTSLMRTGNLVGDVKQTLQAYEAFLREHPGLAEQYPAENATFIVRLLTYLTKQHVLSQFKDPYANTLLRAHFEKAKINLDANEIRFIRLLYIHPLVAKAGFEINKLINRIKTK